MNKLWLVGIVALLVSWALQAERPVVTTKQQCTKDCVWTPGACVCPPFD